MISTMEGQYYVNSVIDSLPPGKYSKSTFFENSSRNTIRVSNSLDPNQARHCVEPDLGPNCL